MKKTKRMGDQICYAGKPEYVTIVSDGKKIIPDVERIYGPDVCDAWRFRGGAVEPGEKVLIAFT